uniref:Uncharacterized protein n=1 Tax=Magallana gigas TaxID=29159 RepID=A0A8W8MPL1_MAGGI
MDQHIINVYELMSLGHTRKAKRRSAALEELSSKGWKNEETRAQIKKILKFDFMSSDEECDDGFITHPPSWQNDTFARLKTKLDTVYLEICSKKSKRLLQKRTVGSANVKALPNYPEECSWMIKND